MSVLSKSVIRAGWNSIRGEIRSDLLEGRITGPSGGKFNQNAVDKVVDNFIESMVFAGIPSTHKKAVAAMFRSWEHE